MAKTSSLDFFYDYPMECKSAINDQYSWFIKLPEPPRKIYAGTWPFNNLDNGVVDEELLLADIIAEGAKVKDLLKALRINALEVIENPQFPLIYKIRNVVI